MVYDSFAKHHCKGFSLIEDNHVEIFASYNKTIGKVYMDQKLARIVSTRIYIHIWSVE